MPNVVTSGPSELQSSSNAQLHIVGGSGDPGRVPHRSSEVVRRRGSVAQGRALEMLGHSVEYLVDSRLFQAGDHNQRAEQEAVQILMRLSRAVFAECPEVVSLRKRLGRWIAERIARDSQVA
jgi:hypothetical protein